MSITYSEMIFGFGSHHLLVVGVKGLLNKRELLSTQLPVGVDKLGKLDTQKVNKS